jgi:glycosyltransferase involved in cell wall biosynthesis
MAAMNKYLHLILTPLYPPSRFGGIEKIVQQLAEGLVQEKDSVIVFALEYDNVEQTRLTIVNEIPVYRIPCISNKGVTGTILSSQKKIVHTVTSVYNRANPAIVHAHDWFVGPAAMTLSKNLGLPLVSIFHSDKLAEYGHRLDGNRLKIHEIQKQLAHNSNRILCYSGFMRNCISESMNIKFDYIKAFRCGVDKPLKSRTNPSFPSLLFLGRLAPEKDVRTLIQAFNIVIRHYPQISLRIVGDGSEKGKLQELVRNLGLLDKVSFLPFTSDPHRVDAELRGSSALILPSVFEPFGLVVLEAISRLVPVIVSNSGGPAEIIRDGITGWCFTPGDYRELSEKILACLEDQTRSSRMARMALKSALRRYSWKKGVSQLKKACDTLIAT